MKEVVLHIGPEKTGTTFLQSVFYANRERLAERGILYPAAGLAGSHHYWLAKGFGFVYEQERYDRDRAGASLGVLREELAAEETETLLLSSEHFDFKVTRAACEHLRNFFHPTPVRLIAFLRNQVDYGQSLYMEHVKWGGESTFMEFLVTQPAKFDFFTKLKAWGDHGAALDVVNYDDARTDLLGTFAATSGLDLANLLIPAAVQNVSPSIDFIELVRQLNVGTPAEERRPRYLELLARFTDGTENDRRLLDKRPWRYPVGSQPIVRGWQDSNRELAAYLNEDFSTFLGGPLLPHFRALRQYDPPTVQPFFKRSELIL